MWRSADCHHGACRKARRGPRWCCPGLRIGSLRQVGFVAILIAVPATGYARPSLEKPYPLRCLMDDSNDLNPWLYTAMLTGRGGELGDARARTVELVAWLVSSDPDDLSSERINSQNARVREWMDRHPDGVRYCFELDAIHQDLDWLLSEWDTDVRTRYRDQPDLMRNAIVYHLHNYHYRVYAYREKVAQLLNACLSLGLGEREVNAERVLAAMGSSLEYRAIRDMFSGLINDEKVKVIVERRNLIAHRALLVYESGKATWKIVTAGRRAQEYFEIGGLGGEAELFGNLEEFHRQDSQKLREATSFLNEFRYGLTKSLSQLALQSNA